MMLKQQAAAKKNAAAAKKPATAAKAVISGEALEEAGVDLDINGNRIGSTLDSDIENIDDNF
jgi:hypothetical protein